MTDLVRKLGVLFQRADSGDDPDLFKSSEVSELAQEASIAIGIL